MNDATAAPVSTSKRYRLNFVWSDPEMNRRGQWVADMMTASQVTAARLRVSPEAIVAQPALETGWGAHVVGKHNLFGIKADASWHGDRVLATTFEYFGQPPVRQVIQDWFRDYPDFAGSIADHLSFLERNQNYLEAGVFNGMGDVAYFQGMQNAGYATDPHYAMNLLAVRDTIRQYFLPKLAIEGDQAAPPIGFSAPAEVTTGPKHRWLMMGAHGADVIELQKKLGFAKPDQLDGWFGKDTKAAVIAFQKPREAVLGEADGIVGDKTWAALDTIKEAA